MKKILVLAAAVSCLGTGALAEGGKSSSLACETNAKAFRRVLEQRCGNLGGEKRAKCAEVQLQKYSQKVRSCTDELQAVLDEFLAQNG